MASLHPKKSSFKLNILIVIVTVGFLTTGVLLTTGLFLLKDSDKNIPKVDSDVLGENLIRPVQETLPDGEKLTFKDISKLSPTDKKEVSVSPSLPEYKIFLVYAPKELVEGSIATFTWDVDGPPATFSHTAVYLGTNSTPGSLSNKATPQDTRYTHLVSDFTQGDFKTPQRFVGNIQLTSVGTYYFRAYAQIDGKNYWTDEYSLEVTPRQEAKAKETKEYSIILIYSPKEIKVGNIATFTWDVSGATTTISHTAIYFGEESKSGNLNTQVRPQDTPYNDLVNDFVDGKYNIPLRFIGNKQISAPGKYYFRGYAQIDGKNLWTDEYSFQVVE